LSAYKAFLLMQSVINEREHGTKHYRISTGELITDSGDILYALMHNDLEIQPTCQMCGEPTSLLPLSERYCGKCNRIRRGY